MRSRTLLRTAIVTAIGMIAFVQGPASLNAQADAPDEPPAEARSFGDVLRVSLLTIGRGDEVWDAFGHNAIVIENLQSGQSIAYDWGRFSFAQEGFWTNLLMGRMQYSMGGAPPQALYAHYESLNRTVTLQELNLSAEAKLALVQEVEASRNSPEYRYEYFLNNCSTRVRDLIDAATGGQLGRHAANSEETNRFHTRRLTQHSVPLWAGFDVLLGNRGDVPISRWEALFTPLELVEEVRDVQVEVGGRLEPLVLNEQTLYRSTRPAEAENPRSMLLTFLGLGLVLGGVIASAGYRTGKGDRIARPAFGLLAAVWSLVAGIVGFVLLFVLITDHVWMHWNENALQFTPISLALVPVALYAAWKKTAGIWSVRLAGACALLSAVGFVLQIFPGFDQGNGELIALALPVHLGLAWALFEMAPANQRV